MAAGFTEQGGVAGSQPSSLRRWLMSMLLRRLADPARRDRKRVKLERARRAGGLPHRVEYFHQIDDPYSHLAVQLLQPMLESYDVHLIPYLVSSSDSKNLPEPDLLASYARYDAALVAPYYGLQFAEATPTPSEEHLEKAASILAEIGSEKFAAAAIEVGNALWSGDDSTMSNLVNHYPGAQAAEIQRATAAGNARRTELGHYSGAMFYYGGEWYWGVDRFYHLENRLIRLGAGKGGSHDLLLPRPEIPCLSGLDASAITLEFYASLRSPYTSIVFDRVLQLAGECRIKLVLRPVLPMVMRGVPLSRAKGFYIFRDTAREAETLGLDWGKFYDPIGAPVLRAYKLFPWCLQQGRGEAFFSAFLRAAFVEGVNTATDSGMRYVVERTGLSWQEALAHEKSGGDGFSALEDNREAMYGFGCWGVPAFRLLNARGEAVATCWGQDRLWLIARKIQSLLGAGHEHR